LKISVSTGLYYSRPYTEILDIISASGAEHIELFLNQAFIDISKEELKKETDKRKLNISSIHLPLTFIAYSRNENEEYWLEKGLEYLEFLDADLLVSHFFYRPEDRNSPNDEQHFENIRKYSGRTQRIITTENLPKLWIETRHHRPDELKGFLECNQCFMTFDVTHSASHGRDIINDYEFYKPHIRNIHLSDFSISGSIEHKVLGHGDLPIKLLIQRLIKDRYNWPVTLEFDFENQQRNRVRDDRHAVDLLKASQNLIKNIL
jgi:sugar phosphate isomerase/epimerase